jgi:hypothetical protein
MGDARKVSLQQLHSGPAGSYSPVEGSPHVLVAHATISDEDAAALGQGDIFRSVLPGRIGAAIQEESLTPLAKQGDEMIHDPAPCADVPLRLGAEPGHCHAIWAPAVEVS